jgi:hypothetical protein
VPHIHTSLLTTFVCVSSDNMRSMDPEKYALATLNGCQGISSELICSHEQARTDMFQTFVRINTATASLTFNRVVLQKSDNNMNNMDYSPGYYNVSQVSDQQCKSFCSQTSLSNSKISIHIHRARYTCQREMDLCTYTPTQVNQSWSFKSTMAVGNQRAHTLDK